MSVDDYVTKMNFSQERVRPAWGGVGSQLRDDQGAVPALFLRPRRGHGFGRPGHALDTRQRPSGNHTPLNRGQTGELVAHCADLFWTR